MKKKFAGFMVALAAVLAFSLVGFGTPFTPVADTFAGGVSGSVTRNALLKSNGDSKVADSQIIDDGTTVAISGPVAAAGKVTITRDPASTANTNASLVVNPATSASNELLLGILDNGTSRFTVDKEGDAVVGGAFTSIGAATLSSTLGVTGSSTLTGGATIGSGGTALLKILSATASVDFTALAAGTCENFNITVTGAADGDSVSLGIPAAAWATTEYATIDYFVSATNTVTVKRCNSTNATTALSNPAPVTVRATVFQF